MYCNWSCCGRIRSKRCVVHGTRFQFIICYFGARFTDTYRVSFVFHASHFFPSVFLSFFLSAVTARRRARTHTNELGTLSFSPIWSQFAFATISPNDACCTGHTLTTKGFLCPKGSHRISLSANVPEIHAYTRTSQFIDPGTRAESREPRAEQSRSDRGRENKQK